MFLPYFLGLRLHSLFELLYVFLLLFASTVATNSTATADATQLLPLLSLPPLFLISFSSLWEHHTATLVFFFLFVAIDVGAVSFATVVVALAVIVVRINGLKQEGGGVNCFVKIFASIEGRVKGYEDLINGKSVQPNIKLLLSLMKKINRFFLRNSRLFLSAVYIAI